MRKSEAFVMIFFNRKLLYPAKPNKDSSKAFDNAFRTYKQHLESIRNELPDDAWKLACLSFHDTRVTSVTQPSKREIEISLSGPVYDLIRDGWMKGRTTRLHFYDARKIWVPQSIINDFWLYEEIHLSDIAAFDYQAMLSKDEIRVQANEVDIFIGN